MANNYLSYSEQISDLTDTEIKWWEQEQKRHSDKCEHWETDEEDGGMSSVDSQTFEDSGELYFSYEIDLGDRSVWFSSEESSDPALVADVVQRFLKECRPDGVFTLTYAETCSKLRLGEFGGGGVFVTADDQKWVNAHEWVSEERKKFHGTTKL